MIETGRFKKIDKERRFCPFCVSEVESEIHFLIYCPTYLTLRTEITHLIELQIPNFRYYSDAQKFQYLLSDECIEITPKFIHNSMELRDQLVNYPEQNT